MSHASPHADAAPDEAPTPPPIVSAVTHGPMVAVLRAFALGMTVATVMFVVNNYLNFWRDWPGVPALLNGGDTTLANLEPICKMCNNDMGIDDLEEFKQAWYDAHE